MSNRTTQYQKEYEFFENLAKILHAFVVFDKAMIREFQRLSR